MPVFFKIIFEFYGLIKKTKKCGNEYPVLWV